MAVRIGHASIDENGKIQGGTAGDQSKFDTFMPLLDAMQTASRKAFRRAFMG